MFNKPFGVLCQFSGEKGVPVLADYIPIPQIYPAGRLDKDSEGLLLLTDDGALQARIANPRFKLSKTYHVQVEGLANELALEKLRQGVVLKDGPTLPSEVSMIEPEPEFWPRDPPVRFRRNIPTCWIALTIREGRNRQVRRMTAAVGNPTLRLIRVSIGNCELGNLGPGQWCECDSTLVQ